MELIRSGGGTPPKKPAQKPPTYAPIHDAPTRAASGLPPDPATRSISPARAVRAIREDANPVYAARQRMEVGLMPSPVERENTTSLLLNAVGYTGNSVGDFNAAVDNINKTFEDVYGYSPTPGLVLDMLRSPVAHSGQALRAVLTGQTPVIAQPPNDLPPEAPGAQARFQFEQPIFEQQGTKQGLAAALKLSVAAHSPGVLLQAVTEQQAKKQVAQIDANVNTPQMIQQTLFSAPIGAGAIGSALSVYQSIEKAGVQPYELKNDPAGNALLISETLPLIGSRGGGAGAKQIQVDQLKSQLDSVAAIQQKIKQTFKGISLPASGVWTSDWQKLALYMQSNKRWDQINRIQQAINYLGYSNVSLDPFQSVDAQGNITNTQAQSLINRAISAEQARKGALTGHWWSPLMGHILGSLPAGVFASGGFTQTTFGVNLGATAQWILGGQASANPTNIPGEAESAVRNSAVLFFDGTSGAWTQGKADLWAATMVADPQFLDPSAIKKGETKAELIRRLETGNPTWLRIAGSVGTDVTGSPQVEQEANQLANTHPGLDSGLNIVGDLVAGSLMGGPEFSTTDLATYARMYNSMDRAEFARLLIKRNPVIKAGTDRSFSLLGKAGARNRTLAAQALDSVSAGRFLREKRFVLDGETGGITEYPFGQNMPNVVKAGEGATSGASLKAQSLAQLVKGGHVDREMYRHLVANEFGQGRLFDKLKATNVPVQSGQLFSRMQRFNKGRLPIYTVHPFQWAKHAAGRTLLDALDTTDHWLSTSHTENGAINGFLGSVRYIENEARVQLTKAATGKGQPVGLMDSADIRRLALRAGMSNRKAYGLQDLFEHARANGNGALIQKIGNHLNEAYQAAGHEAAGLAARDHIYSAVSDLAGEGAAPLTLDHLEQTEIDAALGDPKQIERIQKEFATIREERSNAGLSGNAPNLTSQMFETFSVPSASMPQTTGLLAKLNYRVNQLGRMNRQFILTTYPGLAAKHTLGDGVRAMNAQWKSSIFSGGPVRDALQSHFYINKLGEALSRNPEMHRLYDEAGAISKFGEQRYNLDGIIHQPTVSTYRTGAHLKDAQRMKSAADYVDRLISDGAYRAYQDQGARGVYDFYHTDRSAIRLAGEQKVPADMMAALTLHQIADIEQSAPGFLEKALALKTGRGAKLDFRKNLAKLMAKEKVDIPVTGGFSEDRMHWFNPDQFSEKAVGLWMTPNKFYRGTVFQQISSRLFHDLSKAGMSEQDALHAAIIGASKTTRYHMLDLADALQVEQTLRWSLMFFTKHRLYWTWIAHTLRDRPYLAGVVTDAGQAIERANRNDPNAQPGSLDFQLPVNKIPVIGKGLAGEVGTTFRLPIARLMWLASSDANPGAISNTLNTFFGANSNTPNPAAWKFLSGVTNMTVLGPALQALTLYAHGKIDGHLSSDTVVQRLDPISADRFRRYYDEMQASYMNAHGGRPMPDGQATASALLHLSTISTWQSSNFSGAYPTDPKLSTDRQNQWNTYNSILDPKKRLAYRDAHPWIDTMIGINTSTPHQWTLSQVMWAKFQNVLKEHDQRKQALLADYKATGDIGDLFGMKWRQEGTRYGKQIDQLKKAAQDMGATDWLTQFNEDPLTGANKAYASMLHALYPTATNAEVTGAVHKLDPPEIRQAQHLLDGLTPAIIAKMPAQDKQGAYEARAGLVQMVTAYQSVATDQASRLRQQYFSQVYDKFTSTYNQMLDRANGSPTWRKPLVFEQIREYMDKIDHPVTIDGVKMPSPVRARYALLPPEAKVAYRQSQMVKSWGFLTAFQKHLLGVKVDPKVQAGWGVFYTDIASALRQAKQANPTSSISVSAAQNLAIAKAVDGQYPGFYTDYVRSLMPLYTRIQSLHLGRTAGAAKAWNDYLTTYIEPLATAVGGPVSENGPALVERAKKFSTTTWTNLMEYGTTVGGTGWADTPSTENPQGGALYQRAMQYTDPNFKQEFKAMIASNPQFISLLFQAGG